jgi:hypothetical protein
MKTTKIVIHDLKKERSALKTKIKKLARFKNSKNWYNLGARQQTLLQYQLEVMQCYRNILSWRINAIKDGDE